MARLDTGWHANPKVLSTGVYGMALHAWSISYCDAARSDGFVPLGSWPALLKRGVTVLVGAHLWEPTPGGYQLHDYTDYNRTREQIEMRMAEDRVRKRADSGRNPHANRNGTTADSTGIPRAPGPGPGVNSGGSGGSGSPPRARARAVPPPPLLENLPDEVRARLAQAPIARAAQ